MFTHQVSGFAVGGALVSGHVLVGSAAMPTSVTQDERPSALLFSGFAAPGDPARVEPLLTFVVVGARLAGLWAGR